jgi:hypothetical protein
MNGRVYDPVLGRFLSADPNVDGVEDAQGYNRYSYVGNNPMNASDPSGYFSLKEVLPAIIAIVVTVVAIVTQQYWALNYTGSWLGALNAGLHTLSSIVVGGAAGGFAGGFSGSLLNGGSIGDAFKAGVIGAAVGAATAWAAHGIGSFFDDLGGSWAEGSLGNWGGRTLAHATVGGLASEAQGGSFRHGFYASAASTGFMHSSAGKSLMGNKNIAVRTATAAAIGGTASVLGGGKFANGAVTSAFQHLFNQESKKRGEIRYEPSASVTPETAALAKQQMQEILASKMDDGRPTVAARMINQILDSGRDLIVVATDISVLPIDHIGRFELWPSGNGALLYDPAHGHTMNLDGISPRTSGIDVLAHEISHAYTRMIAGKSIRNEGEAVQVQNQIRHLQGWKLIESYGGTQPVKDHNKYVKENP